MRQFRIAGDVDNCPLNCIECRIAHVPHRAGQRDLRQGGIREGPVPDVFDTPLKLHDIQPVAIIERLITDGDDGLGDVDQGDPCALTGLRRYCINMIGDIQIGLIVRDLDQRKT